MNIDSAYHQLTQREKEIVQLLLDGNSSSEIGEKLNISRHTVDTHRRKILKKLNLKNSVKLVAQFSKLVK